MALQNDQIVIVHGASASFNKLSEITFSNHAEYASKHNYTLRTFKFSDSEGGWGKVRSLQETFADPNIRRAFWIDADAVFTNLELLLTSHLPMSKIAMTCDIFGPNSGSMWLENCEEIRHLLDAIATQGYQLFSDHPWKDQPAFHYFFRWPPYSQLITFVEQTRMNSYFNNLYAPIPDFPVRDSSGQWKLGHFILHLPGLPLEIRILALKKAFLLIKNEK